MTFAKDSSWHKCEVPTALRNVWCWGQSRKHLLARSISHFDPTETSAAHCGGASDAGFQPLSGTRLSR